MGRWAILLSIRYMTTERTTDDRLTTAAITYLAVISGPATSYGFSIHDRHMAITAVLSHRRKT